MSAFSCLDDGGINAPVADSAYKAAREAINGSDPSGGAIYYYNPVSYTHLDVYKRQAYITDAHTRRQKASQQLFRAGGFYYPKATLQTPYFGSVFIEVIGYLLYTVAFIPSGCFL